MPYDCLTILIQVKEEKKAEENPHISGLNKWFLYCTIFSVRIKSLKTFFLSFLERFKNEFVSLFPRPPLKKRHWKSGGLVSCVLYTHTPQWRVGKGKTFFVQIPSLFCWRKKRRKIHKKFTIITLCLLLFQYKAKKEEE